MDPSLKDFNIEKFLNQAFGKIVAENIKLIEQSGARNDQNFIKMEERK